MIAPRINLPELRAELARQGLPHWRLAADIGMSPSALSGYLRGRYPAPQGLRRRIEQALGLPFGFLTPTEERRPGQGGVQETGDGDADSTR